MGSDSDGSGEFESEMNDSMCESYHSSDEDAPMGMDLESGGQNK